MAPRRALEKDAELARRQAPCADCGLPECAGLCPGCSHRRRTEALVREAVDLAVAVRADLSDAAAVAKLTRSARGTPAHCWRRRANVPAARTPIRVGSRSLGPRWHSRIRNERRDAGLRRLVRSHEALAEADAAYEACLRRRGRSAEGAAEQAADPAGRRSAEFLLRQRLGELQAARQQVAIALPAMGAVAVEAA